VVRQTLLSYHHVSQAKLTKSIGEDIAFSGLKIFVDSTLVDAEEFQTLGAGETVEAQWDVAEMHDLSAGGDFDIATTGSLKYATANSTEIIGEASIASAAIKATVDGAQAASVHENSPLRRTTIASDCSSSQRSTLSSAVSGCVQYATSAATAATSGSAAKLGKHNRFSPSILRPIM
jgi:deuterolysin